MGILGNIKKLLNRSEPRPSEKGKGLIILNDVSEAMQAERLLKNLGYEVRGVAPPDEIRKGCDLAVEFNLINQLGVERILKEKGLGPLDVVALDDLAQKPLNVTKEKNFGKYTMITAANMKITVENSTGRIVNISGGGCPDVPYLTMSMTGKLINEVETPDKLGFSLCAYMLQKAYERALTVLDIKRCA